MEATTFKAGDTVLATVQGEEDTVCTVNEVLANGNLHVNVKGRGFNTIVRPDGSTLVKDEKPTVKAPSKRAKAAKSGKARATAKSK